MRQEIEIEYKNLLTKDEFEQLRILFTFPKEAVVQTNYYFETPTFKLQNAHSALRIRKKNNTYTLTLKEPHTVGLLETHETLNEIEAKNAFDNQLVCKGKVKDQLLKLGIPTDEIRFFGSLTTERREITYKNCLLVLDYSMYNNKSDYELELEATDEKTGIQVFNEILQNYRIPKRETPNKVARFFHSFNA